MLLVIRNLREVVDHIAAGINLPDELATWLEGALRDFLEHRAPSVDEALGLRFSKGGVPWWLEEGMRRRDAALRALADRHMPGETTNARAAAISVMGERFAAANWPIDRTSDAMPERYRGTPKELLWVAFKSGAPMPLGARRLRSILAGCADAARGGDPLADEAPCPG